MGLNLADGNDAQEIARVPVDRVELHPLLNSIFASQVDPAAYFTPPIELISTVSPYMHGLHIRSRLLTRLEATVSCVVKVSDEALCVIQCRAEFCELHNPFQGLINQLPEARL